MYIFTFHSIYHGLGSETDHALALSGYLLATKLVTLDSFSLTCQCLPPLSLHSQQSVRLTITIVDQRDYH